MASESILNGAIEAFQAKLAAVTDDAAQAVFAQVFQDGDVVSRENDDSFPLVYSNFENETVEDTLNRKQLLSTRIITTVEFLRQAGVTPQLRQRRILRHMQAAIGADPTLGGTAGVSRVLYDGGGSPLYVADEHDPPNKFIFRPAWMLHYDHRLDDPTTSI